MLNNKGYLEYCRIYLTDKEINQHMQVKGSRENRRKSVLSSILNIHNDSGIIPIKIYDGTLKYCMIENIKQENV